MEDYYAVFDLTPADERNENFIQFGIAQKVESHEFDYQSGPISNIHYDANGNEVYTPIPHDDTNNTETVDPNEQSPSPKRPRKNTESSSGSFFGVLVFTFVCIFGAVGLLKYNRKNQKELDAMNKWKIKSDLRP